MAMKSLIKIVQMNREYEKKNAEAEIREPHPTG